MPDVDLMLPATVPPAMVDAVIDKAGVRREASRLALVRHDDGKHRTYIVPCRLAVGDVVNLTIAGCRVRVSANMHTVAVDVEPAGGAGLLASAVAAYLADRPDGLRVAFDVPALPGSSVYQDIPVLGRCGVRVPRGPLTIDG